MLLLPLLSRFFCGGTQFRWALCLLPLACCDAGCGRSSKGVIAASQSAKGAAVSPVPAKRTSPLLHMDALEQRSWKVAQIEQKSRRSLGRLWMTQAMVPSLEGTCPDDLAKWSSPARTWAKSNAPKKGGWSLDFVRHEGRKSVGLSEQLCCVASNFSAWFPFKGGSDLGPGRCEKFWNSARRSEALGFVLLQTKVLVSEKAMPDPEMFGIPLGDGRFALFIGSLSQGGLSFEQLERNMSQGLVETQQIEVGLPEIRTQLEASAGNHRTGCNEQLPFVVDRFGVFVGTRRGAGGEDTLSFSPKRKDIEGAFTIDGPFEYALVDLHLRMILASGAYYGSGEVHDCNEVGTFAELGAPESAARLGVRAKTRSIGAYLRSRSR